MSQCEPLTSFLVIRLVSLVKKIMICFFFVNSKLHVPHHIILNIITIRIVVLYLRSGALDGMHTSDELETGEHRLMHVNVCSTIIQNI